MNQRVCRREHVMNGDLILGRWDQEATRTVVKSGDEFPLTVDGFIKAINKNPQLGSLVEDENQFHRLMVKLQHLGIIRPAP